MLVVLAGARSPEYLTLVISNSGGATTPLDLSTVESVSLRVARAGAPETRWAAAIQSQTSASLTVRHTWAEGDIDVPGQYRILAEMTIAAGSGGGVRRAGPTAITVNPL